MAADLPLMLLLITFAGNVNRDHSRLIAYLLEQNRVFRELQGKKRLRLSDDQHRRLAAKGKPCGRRLLDKVATIAKTLKDNGIAPSPDRPTSWSTFLKSHADASAAADFFTVDGFLRDMKYLILDNDALYTKQLVRILKTAGTEVVHTAIQAPNKNSLAEQWVLTAKIECLNKMILFGKQHLRRTLSALVEHYNQDRRSSR